MFKQQDQDEEAVCPFNKNHRFARQKLIYHINRCKQRKQLGHLYDKCHYNALHFVKKEQLQMHELTCSDRSEVNRMIHQMQANFRRLRQRSRDKNEPKSEEDEPEKIVKNEDEDEQATLSECEECMETLRMIKNMNAHPKLLKYLKKYQQYSKIKFQDNS